MEKSLSKVKKNVKNGKKKKPNGNKKTTIEIKS